MAPRKFSKPVQFKRKSSAEVPAAKSDESDVKVEIINTKKEIPNQSLSNITSPQEVGTYMSLLSIGAGFGFLAMLKIPVLTWLSMSGCALTLGIVSSNITSSRWYKNLSAGSQVMQTFGKSTSITSAVSIGSNLLFFLPHPFRYFTLTMQASAVAGTLAYGAMHYLPQILKEAPNFKWSESLSHLKTTWSSISNYALPLYERMAKIGNDFFSNVMTRRGEGFMISKFSHAASWSENGIAKSKEELPQVAKEALEILNKRTNEEFVPSGIYQVEKISYRKRKSRTFAIGSFQRMERREGTTYMGKIYAKSSQRSVVIHFEALRPNVVQDYLPRHAHVTSQYLTDNEGIFQYKVKRWFGGEYRVKADESVPLQFTHIWTEICTPEDEKAAFANFSKVDRKDITSKTFRFKFVNKNLMA